MTDSQLHLLVSFIITTLVTLYVVWKKNGVLPFLGMSGPGFAAVVCFFCCALKEVVDLIVNRWNLSQQELILDCCKDLGYDALGVISGLTCAIVIYKVVRWSKQCIS